MKFKWLILIVIVPLFCSAQTQRIDSLKNVIRNLSGKEAIDCLNQLSIEYYVNALTETYVNVHTDTAIKYSSLAYSEAIKIKYDLGAADALQNLGEISRDRCEFVAAEHYFLQSIAIFKKIKDVERWSWANLTLGFCFYSQGRYNDARVAYELALPQYTQTHNNVKQAMLFRLISGTYSARGFYEIAFENTLKAIRITYTNDARGNISTPENMGNLFKDAGESETALTYFRIAAQNAKPTNPVRYNRLMGDIYTLLNQFDSAAFFYKKSNGFVKIMTTDSVIRKRDWAYKSLYLADTYLKTRNYDLAIKQLQLPLNFFKETNTINAYIRVLRLLARCYNLKKNYGSALQYSKTLFQVAQSIRARPFLRDVYELFWTIYDQQGLTDSAYKYNVKYIAIKDSILTDEYRRNIALSEMKAQDEQQKVKIRLLQNDKQLAQQTLSLQQQKIKSESFIRQLLIAGIFLFLFIVVMVFRYISLKRSTERQRLEHELELQQLESKKTKVEFQQQASELEMQALRAQMNPHFIFNCLSSINRFILINKVDEASDYLTKFSRLIRMALHNSEKSLITLESELDALRLYLDLERLRFKNAFNYSITFTNTIDTNAVYIPPMLIQPFAENAIWHGLMHKKELGHLEIQFCAEHKTLTCNIVDNGIGRNMAANFNSRSAEKNKSMGVEITAGRLALLNKTRNQAAVFKIQDLVDDQGKGCGTKVILTIPCKELTEFVD